MSAQSDQGEQYGQRKVRKKNKAQQEKQVETTETSETSEKRGRSQRVVYHLQVSFCGKERCSKCREGRGHGPYWYVYQTHNGHTTRHYIGKRLPPGVQQSTITPWVAYPTSPIPSSTSPNSDDTTTSLSESANSEQERPTIFGRAHKGPLIGRNKEFSHLLNLLSDIEKYRIEDTEAMLAIQATHETLPLDTQRTPQCILLTGEAGIGKTRLAEELGLAAQGRGWLVLWSRIYSQESNVSYRTWMELLRRALQQDMFARNEPLPKKLRPLVALLPELGSWGGQQERQGRHVYQWMQQTAEVQEHQEMLARGDEQERLRIQEAVRALLTMLVERQPILIVLDDLQWADGSSCELLGYLARHIHGYPVLLVGTYRENEQEQHPLQALIAHMKREHTVLTQHIDPLSSEDIGLLVTHATNPTPLPETVIRHIQSHVSGNPFFAEELARSGSLQMLPTTITSTLDSRIGRLSMPCQQMLGNAAVLGNTFELPVILAVEGTSEDEDTLFDLLEEAIQARVLTEESEGSKGLGSPRVTYSFWHPLLASHLYYRTSAARRTRIHQRAALVIQRMYKGHEEEVAATITYHLIESGAPATEIVRYATLAGNRAYAVSDFTEAMQHYRSAVKRIEQSAIRENQAQLAYLLERLAECSMILGKWAEARQLFEQLLDVRGTLLTDDPHLSITRQFIAPVPDDDEHLSVARRFIAPISDAPTSDASFSDAHLYEAQVQALIWGEISRTWRYQGNSVETRRCCERGEEELHEHGITTGLAWAKLHYQDGGLLLLEGRFDEALQATLEALEQFERDMSTVVDRSERDKSRHYVSPDTSAMTRIQRTLSGDPVDIGRAYVQLGLITTSQGQLSTALSYMNKALTVFDRCDQVREIAHVQCSIGYLHLTRGEYQEAQLALQRSLAQAERIGDEPLCSVIYSNMAKLAAASGKPNEAEIWYRRALSIAGTVQDREYENRWNVDLAAVFQEQDKLAEARVCLVKAMRIGWVTRNNSWIGNALVGLGDYRLSQARAEQTLPDKRSHFLALAERDIQRALVLEGLETQTRIRGQLVHAQVSLLLGKIGKARQELKTVLKEARHHELVAIEITAERLLNEI